MGWLERIISQACCPTRKAFKGKIPNVKRAPEPSDIYWENLATPLEEKLRRRSLTNFLSILAMGASFGLIYLMSLG
jgi:hypothetical protein